MAVDVTISSIGSGYNRTSINTNFTAIQTALSDALSRSGSSPNSMSADIDLDSNSLLNVGDINTERLFIDGHEFVTSNAVSTGDRGWSPSLAIVSDGDRRVLQLTTWVGGEGTIPTNNIGDYVGALSFVTDIADAVNIRGAQGASGAGSGDLLAAQNLSDVTDAATAFVNIKQAASTTSTGVVELATNSEAIALSDTGRVITPSSLGAVLGEYHMYIGKQILTGSGTYVKTTGTNLIIIKGCGAGGGGGGANASGGDSGAGGGGGGSGAYDTEGASLDVSSLDNITYSCGAAGTGGSSGADGSNGAATTFGTGGTYLSLGGGVGGEAGSTSSHDSANGGLGGTATTGSSTKTNGDPGGVGTGAEAFGSMFGAGGKGGNTPWGGGGAGADAATSGTRTVHGGNGMGYGSGGGGGGEVDNNGNANGGNGANGVIIIEEYT